MRSGDAAGLQEAGSVRCPLALVGSGPAWRGSEAAGAGYPGGGAGTPAGRAGYPSLHPKNKKGQIYKK